MKVVDLLNKENNNLDLIRIILAGFVIIGHAPFLNGSSAYWVDPIGYFFKFTYSGAFAVKLFFFISGLVVTNSFLSKRSLLYFTISRIFRLIPALFVVLIITVFVVGPLVTVSGTKYYFSHLYHLKYIRNNLIFSTEFFLPGVFDKNLFQSGVNGSLWSLHYEVACYIALAVLFVFLGRRSKYYLNIPVVIILIDSFLQPGMATRLLGNSSEVNLLPASFAFGVFFAINAEVIKFNFTLVLASVLFFYGLRNTAGAEIAFIFTSSIVALYFSSRKLVLKLKPAYDISYGIYLWGFLVQQTLYYSIGHIYVGLHCLLALFISITIAYFSNKFIEKPFVNIGKSFYKFCRSLLEKRLRLK